MTALVFGSVLYEYHLDSILCWLGNEAVKFVYKQFCIARDGEDYRGFCKICFTTYESPVIAVKNVNWKNGWMGSPEPDQDGETFECETCQRTFSNEKNLAHHVRTHHSD